jgi:hypothetical protein
VSRRFYTVPWNWGCNRQVFGGMVGSIAGLFSYLKSCYFSHCGIRQSFPLLGVRFLLLQVVRCVQVSYNPCGHHRNFAIARSKILPRSVQRYNGYYMNSSSGTEYTKCCQKDMGSNVLLFALFLFLCLADLKPLPDPFSTYWAYSRLASSYHSTIQNFLHEIPPKVWIMFNHPPLSSPCKPLVSDMYVRLRLLAFLINKLLQLPQITNAFFLLSAWSAATSDIYVSSRFLFFLSRRGHAPAFLGKLIDVRRRIGLLPKTRGDPTDARNRYVIPVFGVAVAAIFALLSYMSTQGAEEVRRNLSSCLPCINCTGVGISMVIKYDQCCVHAFVAFDDGHLW